MFRFVDELLEKAKRHIDDYCGEGVIALPELTESIVDEAELAVEDAVPFAQRALREYLSAGRIRIHIGRAVGDDIADVSAEEAQRVLENVAHYRYGDGDERRAWFSLEC